MELQDWRFDAACATTSNPDDWYSEDTLMLGRLQTICARCPVRSECLEYAVKNEPDWGVWAGTTPQQRRRLRDRGRAA